MLWIAPETTFYLWARTFQITQFIFHPRFDHLTHIGGVIVSFRIDSVKIPIILGIYLLMHLEDIAFNALYRFFSINHSDYLVVVFIHVILMWGMPSSMKVSDDCLSSFIELLLPLFASRAFPIVRQVFEGHAVVLGGVIHVAADGADVLAGGLLFGEIHIG